MFWGDEKYVKNFSEIVRGKRGHVEDIDTDGGIILK
jgi:hypothetical protein